MKRYVKEVGEARERKTDGFFHLLQQHAESGAL